MGGRGGSSGLSVGGALPKLEGSEKQVAWAQDIRKRIIDIANSENIPKLQKEEVMKRVIGEDINVFTGRKSDTSESKYQSMMREFNESNPKPPRTDRESLLKWREKKREVQEKYEKWLKREFDKKVRSEKSAKWWIDNR